MAENVGSIEYDARINTRKLRGDAAETDAIVKGTGDSVERTGESSFSAFGKWAKIGLLAAGTATAALGLSAFKTGVDYNTLQQTSRAALTTILGSAEAAGKQMDQLNEFVRTSPFGKDVFIRAQQQLLGFGVAAEDIIPALDAVQNAVAAVGGSSDQITGIVDVLADIQSTGRVTGQEFQRLGFFGVDAATIIGKQMGLTSEQIKEMASNPGGIPVGTIWDPLVNGLQDSFGGAAANVKNTWAGTADRIKAAFRDLGSVLAAPFISPTGGGAGVEWGNKFADMIRGLQRDLPPLMEKIKAVIDQIILAIKPMTDSIANNKQAWEALKNIAIALIVIFAGLLVGIIVAVIAVFWALQQAINLVIKFIEKVINTINWLSNVISTVIVWIMEFAGKAVSAFASVWRAISDAVGNAGNLLYSAGRAVISGLINGIRGMAGSLWGSVSEVSSNIGRFFSGAAGWLWDTGRAIVQGLVNGIRSMAGAAAEAARGVASDAINSAKSLLGIRSPSTVFAAIGRNVSIGLAQGITSTGGQAVSAMGNVIGGLSGDMPSYVMGSLSALDTPNGSASGAGVTINLSMNGIMARSKSDERDIDRSLVRRLNEELSAQGQPAIGGGAL